MRRFKRTNSRANHEQSSINSTDKKLSKTQISDRIHTWHSDSQAYSHNVNDRDVLAITAKPSTYLLFSVLRRRVMENLEYGFGKIREQSVFGGWNQQDLVQKEKKVIKLFALDSRVLRNFQNVLIRLYGFKKNFMKKQFLWRLKSYSHCSEHKIKGAKMMGCELSRVYNKIKISVLMKLVDFSKRSLNSENKELKDIEKKYNEICIPQQFMKDYRKFSKVSPKNTKLFIKCSEETFEPSLTELSTCLQEKRIKKTFQSDAQIMLIILKNYIFSFKQSNNRLQNTQQQTKILQTQNQTITTDLTYYKRQTSRKIKQLNKYDKQLMQKWSVFNDWSFQKLLILNKIIEQQIKQCQIKKNEGYQYISRLVVLKTGSTILKKLIQQIQFEQNDNISNQNPKISINSPSNLIQLKSCSSIKPLRKSLIIQQQNSIEESDKFQQIFNLMQEITYKLKEEIVYENIQEIQMEKFQQVNKFRKFSNIGVSGNGISSTSIDMEENRDGIYQEHNFQNQKCQSPQHPQKSNNNLQIPIPTSPTPFPTVPQTQQQLAKKLHNLIQQFYNKYITLFLFYKQKQMLIQKQVELQDRKIWHLESIIQRLKLRDIERQKQKDRYMQKQKQLQLANQKNSKQLLKSQNKIQQLQNQLKSYKQKLTHTHTHTPTHPLTPTLTPMSIKNSQSQSSTLKLAAINKQYKQFKKKYKKQSQNTVEKMRSLSKKINTEYIMCKEICQINANSKSKEKDQDKDHNHHNLHTNVNMNTNNNNNNNNIQNLNRHTYPQIQKQLQKSKSKSQLHNQNKANSLTLTANPPNTQPFNNNNNPITAISKNSQSQQQYPYPHQHQHQHQQLKLQLKQQHTCTSTQQQPHQYQQQQQLHKTQRILYNPSPMIINTNTNSNTNTNINIDNNGPSPQRQQNKTSRHHPQHQHRPLPT